MQPVQNMHSLPETLIVMLTYLGEAWERRLREGRTTKQDLFEAILEGAGRIPVVFALWKSWGIRRAQQQTNLGGPR